MVHLDDGACGPQRLIFCQFLHRQDGPAGVVVLVEDIHGLELRLGHGPLLNAIEDLLEPREARLWRRIVRMGLPIGLADHIANLVTDGRLSDEVDVGGGIGLPALALRTPAWLASALGAD